ncbi:MAG: DHHA1 domain-containing protein [Alphaproteobacteria bacterium]|nr:DHHA1 domain-containing protein [Alphaproteobacteria bacterium]
MIKAFSSIAAINTVADVGATAGGLVATTVQVADKKMDKMAAVAGSGVASKKDNMAADHREKKASDGWQLVVSKSLAGQEWVAPLGPARATIEAMAGQLGISLALAEMLLGRGFDGDAANRFLQPKIRDEMTDPMILRDMGRGVGLLLNALREGQTIALFGDYDVDGACSIALLHRYLQVVAPLLASGKKKSSVLFYVPDRLKEGYGPNDAALDQLVSQGAAMLIFLDCGSSALDILMACRDRWAAKKLTMLVLDHHLGETPASLPDWLALVNPNRTDESGRHTYLCAAGVVFLFLVAVQQSLRQSRVDHLPDLMTYLDLVALATVGDVVPLEGLNRPLVKQGMLVMARRQNIGMVALLNQWGVGINNGGNGGVNNGNGAGQGAGQGADKNNPAGIVDGTNIDTAMTSGQLAFYFCPMINAGGRMGQADLAARLLTTNDAATASAIARSLREHNDERKIVEQQLTAAVENMTRATSTNPYLVMVAGGDWHIGVLGIVASRLKEKYNRPSIVGAVVGDGAAGGNSMAANTPGGVSTNNNVMATMGATIGRADSVITASARSVRGIDIGSAIMAAKQAGLLLAGGGHKMAGGFKCRADQWEKVQSFLTDAITHQCGGTLPQIRRQVAACLPLPSLNVELALELEQLEPCGVGNRAPLIMVKDAVLEKTAWLKEKHLSLFFVGGGKKLRAMMFHGLENPVAETLAVSKRGTVFHLLGTLSVNEWQGNRSVDFFIQDAVQA